MSNLIPEQRRDRNGKLVTRHVKSEGSSSSSMTNVPAPKLQAAPKDSLTAGIRLVPSQERRKERNASGATVEYREAPVMEASDVEMYGVLSVAVPSTALRLLADGVVSAEEAVERLTDEGREDEILDRSGLAREMLTRRVAAEFFIMGLERLSNRQLNNAAPELLADYSEFFATRSIMRKDSPQIADEVLSGEISLADVHSVGIDNLKTGGRLETARPAFKELKKGNDKFTVEDLKEALQKRRSDHVAAEVNYLIRYGRDSLERLSNLGVNTFSGMSIGDLVDRVVPSSQGEALAVIDYTGRLMDAAGLQMKPREWGDIGVFINKAKLLHNNGVDVQYAAERIHDEDVQVIAATFHGSPKAVSSGWL